MKVQVLLTTVGLACAGFGAGYPSDLVFYTKLDSAADITTPQVGPSGTANGATFDVGKVGNALSVSSGGSKADFPLTTGLPIEKGCIEFYAKLVTEDTTYYDGALPCFFKVVTDPSSIKCRLAVYANDGVGQHGLGLNMLGIETGLDVAQYSGWGASFPYSTIFGEGDSKAWHHYAIVWNTNGIAESSQALRVYVDDIVVMSREKYDGCDLTGYAQQMLLQLTTFDVTVHLDEFRIWSTDRTTFPEGPINPDVVPPVVSEVTAKQHYPWCGKVDIGYTIAGSTDGLQVKITVKDNTNDKTYEAKTFDKTPTAAVGMHTVVWDATADGVTTASQNMVATVSLIVPVPAE